MRGDSCLRLSFSIDHALTCKTGGFPAIRHNEVRDITASLLSEVCHGVTIEPHLQPLTGEVMPTSKKAVRRECVLLPKRRCKSAYNKKGGG